MLANKLDSLLNLIHAKNTELAEYAGFDRTNISRIRSGKRTPSATGKTMDKLSNGIYLYCLENDMLSTLCKVLDIELSTPQPIVKLKLKQWLNSDTVISEDIASLTEAPFATKLDTIMNLTGMTNTYLSKIIYVDASLISRYRRGTRRPNPKSETSETLCNALWDQISNLGLKKDTAIQMSLTEDSLTQTAFEQWLFKDTPVKNNHYAFSEKFLSVFNSAPNVAPINLPSFEECVPKSVLNDKKQYYIGTEGLQEAVLRFLGTAILNNSKELFLYSDQNMDWMVKDSTFKLKWLSLMIGCLKRGIHIKIIHNIDRNLKEMADAITSWLPLYMSGLIESYYCNKQRTVRFSHTLFLNPGISCIDSYNSVGSENAGIYNYYTDSELLESCEQKYQKLRESTHPLMKINPPIDTTGSSTSIYIEKLDEFPDIKIYISPSLIRVEHGKIEHLSFGFTHPLMCRAFMSYAADLDVI